MSDLDGQDAVSEARGDEPGSDGILETGVSGWTQIMLIGAPVFAVGTAISSIILSAGSTIMAPFRAFGSGLASLITGTFGGPVIITESGAIASAESFGSGLLGQLGPAQFPVAVLASMAGMAIFILALRRLNWSPLGIFSGGRR